MDLNEELRVTDAWSLKGELDAVVQLRGVLPLRAVARPERADRRLLPDLGLRAHRRGAFRRTDLAGVKFGFMAEIPGKLGRGNWTVALFVDDKASVQADQGADLDHDRPRRRLDRAC